MKKKQIKEILLSFVIFFGSISIIGKTIAMQDPEHRMNAVIHAQQQRQTQMNSINENINRENQWFNSHGQNNCNGSSVLCNTEQNQVNQAQNVCTLNQHQNYLGMLQNQIQAIRQTI